MMLIFPLPVIRHHPAVFLKRTVTTDNAAAPDQNIVDSVRERVGGAIDTFQDALDPSQAIADLNSDGDRAVRSLTLETKTTVPVPCVPPGTGLQDGNLAWSDQVPVWNHGQADDAPDPGGNPPPTADTSS